MTRPAIVLSHAPQPRRRPSLRVRLLEGGGSHDPASARRVPDSLRCEQVPFSDSPPIDAPRPSLLDRLIRWADESPAAAAIAAAVLAALWTVMVLSW